MDDIMEIKCDVMVNWLHKQQMENMWTNGGVGEGVVLKKSRDSYTACPKDLEYERDALFDAVYHLNVKVENASRGFVLKSGLADDVLPGCYDS